MAAKISSKVRHKSVASEFLKRSAGLISQAAGDYISEYMPVSSDVVKDAQASIAEVTAKLHESRSSMQSLKKLKMNISVKNIYHWFMDKENEFDDNGQYFGDDLSYDTDTGDEEFSSFAEIQVTEGTKNANKIAGAVVSSARQQVESQMVSTAEIKTALSVQTAAITSGFKQTNDTLDKILEVLTKNTATLIETTVAGFNQQQTANEKLISSGKFNLSDYKDVVKSNFKNSELGMLSSFAAMFSGEGGKMMAKQALKPEVLVSMAFQGLVDKKAPNLGKNLQALDEAVNNVIMGSLIRLGNKGGWGLSSTIGRMFGLRADRQEFGNVSKSKLELKAVPFDTQTKEAIVHTIPGYLRDILKALNGKDNVYDYRTRSFRTQNDINRELHQVSRSSGTLYRANNDVRRAFGGGSDQYGSMLYDIMMSQLSGMSSYDRENQVKKFSNPRGFASFMEKAMREAGVQLSQNDRKTILRISKAVASNGMNTVNIGNQAAMNTPDRNKRMKAYVEEAQKWGVDITDTTSSAKDTQEILRSAGLLGNQSKIKGPSNNGNLRGVDYTNAALYEMYKLLNRGINVYQVGSSNTRTKPYRSWTRDKHLAPPINYRTKQDTDESVTPIQSNPDMYDKNPGAQPSSTNQLRNNRREDGSMEDLSVGERIGRWGKTRGGELANAIVHGNADDVRVAFNAAMNDVIDVAGSSVIKGASKINKAFGNVTGHLKHQLFGSEYKYTDENGNIVKVEKNKKGGIMGFVGDYIKDSFKGTGDKAKKWYDSVKSYFDFGGGKGEDGKVVNKRKKFIGASVGAMAGAGILGGPLGLLMGAIGGSVISEMPNIGSKIRNLLFGRDKETGKAKGLFTKLSDAIMDPIRFTIGKTFSHFGEMLKKNVLGPISDIGVAIKERVTDAAQSTFSKAFHKIVGWITAPFRGIGRLITRGLKGLGNGLLGLMGVPIRAAGAGARGAATVGSGIFGAIAEGAAHHIGRKGVHKYTDENGNEQTMSTWDYIKQRKQARNEEYANSEDRTKYKNLRTWKKEEHMRQVRHAEKLGEYTEEKSHIMTPEEIAAEEASKRTASNTSEINDNLNTLVHHATHTDGEHSIFTHDDGLRKGLNKIIKMLAKKFGMGEETSEQVTDRMNDIQDQKVSDKLASDRDFAKAGIGASLALITEGDVTKTDQDTANQILEEASKTNPNAINVKTKLRKLLMSQKEKDLVVQTGEKKESLLEKLWNSITGGGNGDDNGGLLGWLAKLLNFLKNNWPVLIGILTAILAFLKKDNNIGNNVGNSAEEIIDSATSKDPVTNGANAFMNLFDTEVKDKWDLANPLATLYHGATDAAGNRVVNPGATHAKRNWQIETPIIQSVMKPAWQNILAGFYGNKAAGLNQKAAGLHQTASDIQHGALDYVYHETIPEGSIVPYGTELPVFEDQLITGVKDPEALAQANQQYDAYQAKAGEYQAKAGEYQAKADEHSAKAKGMQDHAGSEIAGGVAKGYARVGMMTAISNVAGAGVEGIARGIGVSDENASKVGNVATALTTSGLMVNQLYSDIKGKNSKSIIDKALSGIKKVFDYAANSLGMSGKLSQFASNISKFFDDIYDKTVGKITSTIANKVVAALGIQTTEATASQAAAVATVGLGVAAAGVSGGVHGAYSVANLFRVTDDKVDGIMKGLSVTLNALWSALEWVPYVGYGMAALDVLDAFVFQGILGTGIKQYIADFLYNLIKGDGGKHLKELQQGLVKVRDDYTEKFGVELPVSEMNNMVNNTGFFDTMWRGKFGGWDEGGARKNTGLQSKIYGQDTVYMHDEEGNVVKDKKGRSVAAVDMYGNKIKKDEKAGDKFSKWWNKTKRWWVGGDLYTTDANGQALVDENGEYMVGGKDLNVLQRGKNKVQTVFDKYLNGFKQIKTVVERERDYANTLLADKDSDFADVIKVDGLDEDNPLTKPVKTLIIASRLSIIPGALVKRVGGILKDKIGEKVNKAKSTATQLGSNLSSIFNTAVAGDMEGLASASFQEDPDNPVGSAGKAVFGIAQSVLSIVAFVSRIGHLLSNGVHNMLSKQQHSKEVLEANKEVIAAAAAAGDVDALNKAEFQNDEDDPVGGFTKGIFGVYKAVYHVPAYIHKMGNWLKDWWSKTTLGHSFQVLGKNHEKLKEAAQSGDTEALNSMTFKNDENDPVGSWVESIFNLDKAIFNIPAGIKSIGKMVSDSWDKMVSSVKNDYSALDTGTDKLYETAKKGDVGAVWSQKLVMDEHDPLAWAWSASFNINKVFALISSLINKLGNWAKKYIGEGAEKFWDWIKGADESESTSAPSSGTGGVGGPQQGALANQKETADQLEGGNPLDTDFKVTSGFGHRTFPRAENHAGIDLVPADKRRNSTVSATYSGTISKVVSNVPDSDTAHEDANGKWTYKGTNSGGNQVWIKTPSGLVIKNMHLKANSIPTTVRVGTAVEKGDPIGKVGSTGFSTAPHLHYQIEKNNKAINPAESVNRKTSSSGASGKKNPPALETFLKICEREIGVVEDSVKSNDVKYNTWFYGHEVWDNMSKSGDTYPWCMAFVQWCFDKGGYPLKCSTPGCYKLLDWYQTNDPARITMVPQPGDIVIYNFSHTGIVKEVVDSDTFKAIEGNTASDDKGDQRNGGCVALKTRSISKDVAGKGFIRAVDWATAKPNHTGDNKVAVGGPITPFDLISPQQQPNAFEKFNQQVADIKGTTSTSQTSTTPKPNYAMKDPYADIKKDLSSTPLGQKMNEMSEETKGEGGNPLNKEFKITSPFGNRTFPRKEMHYGVDLVPADNSQEAEVGSRFSGKVAKVVSNVSDSDTAVEDENTGVWNYYGAKENSGGNQVWIDTDSGLRVKMMHLKANSIPTNITEGAKVTSGMKVGEIGRTGFATAPHLHYQMEFNQHTGNKAAYDPAQSLNSNGTIQFTSPVSTTQDVSGAIQDAISTDAPSSQFDGVTSTAATGAEAGVLAQLMTHLKSIGSKFLSLITGGLLNGETSSSSSGGSGSDGFMSALSSGVGSVQAFLDMCQKEVGTKENPPNSNKVKYNQWFYGSNVGAAWCMAFVQWCFNNAGLTLPYKTARCSDLLDYYRRNEPQKLRSRPEPGDIFFKNASGDSHTGIVKSVNGDTFTTIEGNAGANTDSVVNGSHPISYAKGGFAHPIDWSSLDNVASSTLGNATLNGEGKQAIWNFLKGMGLDDYAAAGIMGNWEVESGNNPAMVEGGFSEKGISHWKECLGENYLDEYKTNRAGVDKYFDTYLKPGLKKLEAEGKRVDWDFYQPGGHAYPGIGLSGWTGTEAIDLMNYADQNGKKWYDLGLQLNYFKSKFAGKTGKVNSLSSPEAATQAFQKAYYLSSLDMTRRQNSARSYYNQFAGSSGNATLGVGGPLEDVPAVGGPVSTSNSSIGSTSYTPRAGSSARRTATTIRPITRVGGSVTRVSSPSTGVRYTPTTIGTANNAVVGTSVDSGADINQVVTYMGQIIQLLSEINLSEDTGNRLLGAINEKDFQDTELRNTFRSLKNVKRTKSYDTATRQSQSTNRSVSALASGR